MKLAPHEASSWQRTSLKGWSGAPGGIRTPDLLIRSPMPAKGASLPISCSTELSNGPDWGGIPVSIELAIPMSLMPSPDAKESDAPRYPEV